MGGAQILRCISLAPAFRSKSTTKGVVVPLTMLSSTTITDLFLIISFKGLRNY